MQITTVRYNHLQLRHDLVASRQHRHLGAEQHLDLLIGQPACASQNGPIVIQLRSTELVQNNCQQSDGRITCGLQQRHSTSGACAEPSART